MIALLIIGGLGLLVLGGELLVRGAVCVASRLGISPLIIGLTFVGFGTSTPELVTSVQASLAGSPGIALGNIVGSNIANILLILGVSALIAPISVASAALKRDGAAMIAVTIVFVIFSAIIPFSRATGAFFILLLVAYVSYSIHEERKATSDHGAAFDRSAVREAKGAAPEDSQTSWAWALALSFIGLGLVVLGGKLLVDGAVSLARIYGISETVIGLTIVAVGTSMPEFVTSIIASIRRQSAIAFGNIVGSNIYNILGIGGTTALISPTIVPDEIVRFDNWIMIVASVIMCYFAWTGRRIGRREGGLLIAGYIIYLAALWPS